MSNQVDNEISAYELTIITSKFLKFCFKEKVKAIPRLFGRECYNS